MAASTHHQAILFTTYTFLLLLLHTLALNSDGTFLLAFRYSILNDPLSTLSSWHYYDPNPCSWTGVTCAPDSLRVISLHLPNAQLLGSIPPDLFLIENLQHLDLSNNFFNGTLPDGALFNHSRTLQYLSLANNEISGGLPLNLLHLPGLNYLNLSDNALAGSLPSSLGELNNLTVVSLKGNYFSGSVPGGLPSIQVLDLSSNLFNGSLPEGIGGESVRYLNFSNNKLTGELPSEFGSSFPENSTVDLSFNNLTGRIPDSKSLVNQKSESFAGNPDLCGKPLTNPCLIPSTLSSAPNVSDTISPAIAVIPKTDGDPDTPSSNNASLPNENHSPGGGGLKPTTIVGITVADLAGIGLLAAILLWLYQMRKKRQAAEETQQGKDQDVKPGKNFNSIQKEENQHQLSLQLNTSSPKQSSSTCCPCIKGANNPDAASESRTSSSSSDGRGEGNDGGDDFRRETEKQRHRNGGGGGTLVMVDGETELELESLLKASAYILGASGGSIVYKAVLEDGRMTFAVRRLGEIGVGRMRDFENQMRMIAKLKHPNLVKVRGFYWGSVEKLMICDYVSNGSLASSTSSSGYKKIGVGSSPSHHLPLEVRLKVAKGVAKALSYIHDKKFVHGNVKPSNILLTPDMDPILSDLGLNWLIHGTATTTTTSKGSTSGRQFGSKRSTHDFTGTSTTNHDVTSSPYIGTCSSTGGMLSPYQAPESLKNLKPNPKWDVYSFGVVLLELLTGKVHADVGESSIGGNNRTPGGSTITSTTGTGSTPTTQMGGDRYWVLRVADVGIRAEIQGREEIMAGVFKLGFNCANLVPTKRPSMKEALQVIEKIPLSWCQ